MRQCVAMDDTTKKLLDHEASTVRGSMPDLQEHVSDVHDNTHATRAHLVRLGITEVAFREGRVPVATTAFGMVVGRLAMHCHLPAAAFREYVHALYMDQFPSTSISDEVVAHIGIAAAQQLERFGRFAIGELRSCMSADTDPWPALSFLMEFLCSAALGMRRSASLMD